VRAYPLTLLAGSVPVVGGGADAGERQCAHGGQLVAGQRLGRRQIDGTRRGRCEQPGEDRQQVPERLAGGGACRDDHGATGERVVGQLYLVLPRPFDAPRNQALDEERVGPLRPVGMPAGAGGDGLYMRDRAGPPGVEGQAAKQPAAVHVPNLWSADDVEGAPDVADRPGCAELGAAV
jgi:hypothetical protein